MTSTITTPELTTTTASLMQDESTRSMHKAFEDAKTFLYYLDSGKGYEACAPYCIDGGASFSSQCETLSDIKTVKDYAEWMQELVTQVFQGGCSRQVQSVSYDEQSNTVAYIAMLMAKGGTDTQDMTSDYTYLVTLNETDGKVQR